MSALAEENETDILGGLSWDRKHTLLVALLREAMHLNGDTGLLPVEDEDGRPFGYYVPPKAAAELFQANGPKLSPDESREAEVARRDRAGAIPISRAAAEFRRMADELRSRTP